LYRFDRFIDRDAAVINGVDLGGYQDIVLISGPILERGASESSMAPLEVLDRRVNSADLCGRSWQDEPKDVFDLILNTFKPIFCEGSKAKGRSPSKMFLEKVNWNVLDKDGSILLMGEPEITVGPCELRDQVSMARLLVIASSHATKSLLGGSVRRFYLFHSQRNLQSGGSPLFLRDIVPHFISPLESLDEEAQARLELAILPDPVHGPRFRPYYMVEGVGDSTFSDLRINYLRRVHFALGCEQHAIW
jgi:hypothetical protein